MRFVWRQNARDERSEDEADEDEEEMVEEKQMNGKVLTNGEATKPKVMVNGEPISPNEQGKTKHANGVVKGRTSTLRKR